MARQKINKALYRTRSQEYRLEATNSSDDSWASTYNSSTKDRINKRRQDRYRREGQRYRSTRRFGNAVSVGLAVLLAVLMIWVATDIKQDHVFDRYDNSPGVAKTFMAYLKEVSQIEGIDYREWAEQVDNNIGTGWLGDILTWINAPIYTIKVILVDIVQYVKITVRYLF